MIILRPSCGLCNRLRAIGSAFRLSRELKVGLRVEWFRCPIPIRMWPDICGMRAGFGDLFEPIEGVDVCERIMVRNDFPWNYWKWSRHNPGFYGGERRVEFVRDMKSSPDKDRWLWTCFPFYSIPDFTWLKPKPRIEERINTFARRFGDRCIGIHVRRTDNSAAIEGSPLSLFEEKIEAEIRSDDQVRFFLSSDGIDVKVQLRKKYGDRILFCEDVAPRFSSRGGEDAVVDLMLLSRTKRIYGSYWSSFSEVASQIGGIPVDVLVKSGIPLPAWVKA